MREVSRLSKVKPCARVHPINDLLVAPYLLLPNPAIGSRPRLNPGLIRSNGGARDGVRG
jgi:hypothetical protein